MLDVVSSTFSKKRQRIEIEKARKSEEGRKKILAALMGELFTSEPELRAAVLHFCKRAMRRRNKIVREVLDLKTILHYIRARAESERDDGRREWVGVDLRPSRQWHQSN